MKAGSFRTSKRQMSARTILMYNKKIKSLNKKEGYHHMMQEQVNHDILWEAQREHQEILSNTLHNNQSLKIMQSPSRYVEHDRYSKSNYQTSSLNDWLKIGPPLKPLIFDILLRSLIKNVSMQTITNAFLRIRIHRGVLGVTTSRK